VKAHEPALTAKLKAQHDEASEIAARLEDSHYVTEQGSVQLTVHARFVTESENKRGIGKKQ
jgi:hypothetical protein